MKKNIDSLIAAVAGFIIIILYTHHGGIGVSPDSTVYMSAAENLRDHGSLSEFSDNPVVDFPAFYPFFLSCIIWITTLKPLVFAPYLNAFLFAALIYLSGTMIEKFKYTSKWYKAAVLSCIVLSPGLLEDYSMLWSETLFIILLLLFIKSISYYLNNGSRKALIIAAILAAMASVTRYAGITIIGCGGVLLLLNMKIQLRKKIIDIIIYSVISPLLLIVNLTMNYVASGTLTGDREKSLTSFQRNLSDIGKVFCEWLPFLQKQNSIAITVAILVIAGLLFICLKQFLLEKKISGYLQTGAAFSLVYISFMLVTATFSRFEGLNSRFLSPAFIPLLWSGSNWLVPAYQKGKPFFKKAIAILGVIIFISFQYNQLKADEENWEGIKDAGIPGYTEDSWKYSETVQYVQKNIAMFKDSFSIYSDAPGAIYFFMHKPGMILPHKESKQELKDFMDDQKCYVIWFNDGKDPDVVDQSYIIDTKKMKLVKQLGDGAIYVFGE